MRQLVARHTVLEQLVMAAGGGDMEPDHPLETRSISTYLQYLHIIYTISTLYLHRATSHAASQTETHPLASPGLDPDYRWNEWDLRREALEVCRMRWVDIWISTQLCSVHP